MMIVPAQGLLLERVFDMHRVMVDGVFSQLDEAISTLAGVDVDTLAPDQLDAVVVGRHRARQRLAGVGAGLLARWDTAAGVWRTDGSRCGTVSLAVDPALFGMSGTARFLALERGGDGVVAADTARVDAAVRERNAAWATAPCPTPAILATARRPA